MGYIGFSGSFFSNHNSALGEIS
jgi:hypothetical protein